MVVIVNVYIDDQIRCIMQIYTPAASGTFIYSVVFTVALAETSHLSPDALMFSKCWSALGILLSSFMSFSSQNMHALLGHRVLFNIMH